MEATAARLNPRKEGHWYTMDGKPCHTVIGSTTGRERPTNISDARKMNLLRSVTSMIDSVLRKPALEAWKTEQALMACLTSPRKEGEGLDEFVKRVLHEDKEQEEEAKIASDLGSDIHHAMESLFKGEQITEEIRPWVSPAYEYLRARVKPPIQTEITLVGDGYAGRTDLIATLVGDSDVLTGGTTLIVDFKSTKKLPKSESYIEHRFQLAAYAKAYCNETGNPCITANLYISTTDPGQFKFNINPPWMTDYSCGFLPIKTLWCHINNYIPGL